MEPGATNSIIPMLTGLAFVLFIVASLWIVNTKAGHPGWAAIIPFYNVIVLCQIAGKPWWWFFLLMIPFVQIIFIFMICIGVANNFGKGALFGVGLVFLPMIFYPILAFSDAQYSG